MARRGTTEGDRIAEIARGFLAQQARTAVQEGRELRRGTHAKGVCVRGVFEILDVRSGRPPALAARLARGLYERPASYATTVRFANSNPNVTTDWQPDVRGMSCALDLTSGGGAGAPRRQDYSMQSAPTLPFNDVNAFRVFARVVGAVNEAVAVGSLSFRDQSTFAHTKLAVLQQQRQPVRPYQLLRYWSNVPFRHGREDVIKYSASPVAANQACALDRHNPNALRDEMIRHVNEDPVMSAFDIGVQFLDVRRMTYQGRRRDATFWIENASVEWPEAQAPFHTVARLTLSPQSVLSNESCEATYFDVAEHSTADSAPLGGINRARWHAEAASRSARLR